MGSFHEAHGNCRLLVKWLDRFAFVNFSSPDIYIYKTEVFYLDCAPPFTSFSLFHGTRNLENGALLSLFRVTDRVLTVVWFAIGN